MATAPSVCFNAGSQSDKGRRRPALKFASLYLYLPKEVNKIIHTSPLVKQYALS